MAASAFGTFFWLDQQLALIRDSQAGTPSAPLAVLHPLAPMAVNTADIVTVPAASTPPRDNKPLPSAAEKSAKSVPSESPSAPPRESRGYDSEVRRSMLAITVHPANEAGYAALANGRLDSARDHYQQALKSDQRSRDALLGLAATAMGEGRREEAARRYDQLLAQDPRDPDAHAGVALLRGTADPVAHESRLKTLLAERGDSAVLLHAMGTLLAHQQRWGEAQEAFFRAVTLAPRSADYHFNLAVSLEHLGQYPLARDYYRRALDLAGEGSATFNRDGVQARLSAINAITTP